MQSPHLSTLAVLISAILVTPFSIADENASITSVKDDVVISASKVETKRVETGSSVTVIDEKYLEQNQSRSVAEILRDVPGVHVASTGGLGKKTSVFIRGSASTNTVVVIDGVKVSDRSSSSGGFDFAHLMTDSIERIEVLRGPQSAIWGSDAMGGVINIVTKKGKGPTTLSANVEVGSNNYHKSTINLSGSTQKSNFSLSASEMKTDGYSTKTGEYDDPDDDGYKNKNVALKGGYQFTSLFSMDAIFNYTDSESEYDAYKDVYNSYDPTDDNDVYSTYRQRLAKINTYLNLFDDSWQNRLSIAYSDSNSENIDPNGYYGSYTENSGDNIKTDLQSDYLFVTGDFDNRLTLVGEIEKSTYQAWGVDDEEKMNSSAIIGEASTSWKKTVFVTASFRQDFNDQFDDTNTYKLDASAWASDGIRLHTSYGTGVKNPTFSQLFGYYATPDLNTETSKGWDAGIEYNFASVDGYIDLTYFDSSYTDAIRWDGTLDGGWGGYVNQDENSQGIELSSFVRLTADLRLNGQYTYMQTDDGTAEGNDLVRRPDHSASINANYSITTKWNANLGVQYVGVREDNEYDAAYNIVKVSMPSYTLFNLATSYQVHKRVSVFGRVENLFDKEYVDVIGYGTEGITGFIGFTVK